MINDILDNSTEGRKQLAIRMTSYILHKHYCENDVEAFIRLMRDPFTWFGTGENECATGYETVSGIFREFKGLVPRCEIYDEAYDAIEIAPDAYLCSGRLWICTDPSEGVCVRVHQRTTMAYCCRDGKMWCNHIHISNPYVEMAPEDVGFPTRMARQSYEYLQECIAEQKKKNAEQTEELASIYNTVPCLIARMLRTVDGFQILTFNRALAELVGRSREEILALDWSRGYCGEVVKEDRHIVERSLRSLVRPGNQSVVEYRFRNAFGECRYVSCTHLLVSEDENGQVIQKIAFDITDRVELEKILQRKSFEDALTGLYNRNKFNQEMDACERREQLGLACFDINGLKAMNDRMGHTAGDDLIRRTASHISRYFEGKAYRVGGDEFVVIDSTMSEAEFLEAVEKICRDMNQDDIYCSVGCSWRSGNCDANVQFNEADRLMYLDKEAFYSLSGHDRRKK